MKRLSESRLVGLGTVLVLVGALVRVVVSIDPMPVWSMDPFAMWIPPTGIGPTALLSIDLLGIVGAALVLAGVRDRVRTLPALLLLTGLVSVAIHSVGSTNDAEIGLSWACAVAGGFAMTHLPRASLWRAVAIASILAVTAILVGRSVVQVFVEHPQTIASYEQTRESFLRSQGWSPDSSMARNYERRLYQAEASGWFGLSNVFGSIMVSLSLCFGVMGIGVLRQRVTDRRVPIVLILACVLCLGGLALSMSKGAAGAGVVALVAFIAAIRFPRRARVIAGLVPVFVLLGVVARGLVGERLGELSILFRWFYMEGATRIFLEHPILGVGPAGFKEAYLIAKPPISPEEVTSAHNLLFDWLATLGVAALAWIGLLGLACRRIGQVFDADTNEYPVATWETRPALMTTGVMVAVLVAVSAFVERSLLTPEMGMVRAFGLLGGLSVAAATICAIRAHGRAAQMGVCAGALTLLAHLQIEVTGVWAGAAPMAFVLLGLACKPIEEHDRHRSSRFGMMTSIGLIALVVTVATTSGVRVFTWESAMGEATAAVRPWAEPFSLLNQSQPGSPEFGEAIDAFARLSGSPQAQSVEALGQQVDRTRRAALEAAGPNLIRAATIRPEHGPTRESALMLLMRRAEMQPMGEARTDLIEQAVSMATGGVIGSPGGSSSWRLLASTLSSAAALSDEGDQRSAYLMEAYEALVHASEHDPYGLDVTLKLVDLANGIGRIEDARAWAKRALAINANLRLDPLKQMTDAESARLERLASGD